MRPELQKKVDFAIKLIQAGAAKAAKAGLKGYQKYPKLFKRLVQCVAIWLENHPKAKAKYGSAYNLVYMNLFCTSMADFNYKTQPDLWGGRLDCKKYLEQYFGIEL